MTSRFTLLLVTGALLAGCSSPDEGSDGPPPPPTSNPPGPFGAAASQGGSTQTAPQGQGGQTAATGTGGSAPVATGGAGGATGSAGTAAGTAGAGGTTGSTIPTGSGFTITPVNGYVAGTTNGAGIQGTFVTFSDSTGMPAGTTTIQPATFMAVAGYPLCVSGSASQVQTVGGVVAYGQYYGGGIGLTLAEPGNMMPAQPWDRGDVVGFTFNVTGTTVPTDLRFQVTYFEGAGMNTSHCKKAVSGANRVLFSEVINNCYEAGGLAIPETAQIQSVQWLVATNITAPTPFNFCIDSLTALTQ